MRNKSDLYNFINDVLSRKDLSKTEVLDVFIEILKEHFSVEEMFGIIGGSYLPPKQNQTNSKKNNDIMSYPSVIGIPISLIYEKLFKS